MGNPRSPMARGRMARLRKGGSPAVNLPYITNLKPSNVAKARAAYSAMLAGTRNMRTATFGSSVARGVDETSSPYNEQYARSLTWALASLFGTYGIPTGDNSWFGISGANLADYLARDKRLVCSGTAALGSTIVLGGGGISMSSATARVEFTPVGEVSECVISTMNFVGFSGATLAVYCDGVFVQNIAQTAATFIRKTTVPLGTKGVHTIRLDWVSGSNALYGIEAYDATRKEVTFLNWAISGGTSSMLVDNTGSPQAGRVNQMTNNAPDLVLGGNELVNSWRAGVAVNDVVNQEAQFMDYCKAMGSDYIFVVPPFDSGSSGATASQQTYIDAVKAKCVEKGYAYFDTRQVGEWASKAAQDAAGYSVAADFVHLTDEGQAGMASLLRPLLFYAMGISQSLAPTWAMAGAKFDLDFTQNRYHGLTSLTDVIQTTRSTADLGIVGPWGSEKFKSFPANMAKRTDRGLHQTKTVLQRVFRNDDLADASWTKNGVTVTSNAGTAPDGTLTADRVTSDGAGTAHNVKRSDVAMQSGATFIRYVYIKKEDARYVQLACTGAGWASPVGLNVDLDTLAVQSVGSTLGTNRAEAMADGWVRCMFATAGAANGTGAVSVGIISSIADGIEAASTTTGSVLVWGDSVTSVASLASLEPVPPVLGMVGQVSRAADQYRIIGLIEALLKTGNFSVYVEVEHGSNSAVTTATILGSSAVASRNAPFITGTTNTQFKSSDRLSSTKTSTMGASKSWANAREIVKMTYGQTFGIGRSNCANGGTVGTDAFYCDLSSAGELRLGTGGNSTNDYNGFIRRMAVWDSRLDDATLQALST
jgi:hypothetical protein